MPQKQGRMSASAILGVCIVFALCACAIGFVLLWTRAAMAFEFGLRTSCGNGPSLVSPRSGDTTHALGAVAAAAPCPPSAITVRDPTTTLRSVGDKGAALLVRFADGSVVVAFRGTRTTEDAIINLDVTQVDNPFGDGRVHRGFLEQYQTMRPELRRILSDALDRGDELYLTGHSLGAALATIAFDDLRHTHAIAACETFGSPKVGDARYAKHLESVGSSCVRVHSNALDPVCTIPAKRYFAATSLVCSFVQDCGSWNDNHAMRTYLEQARRMSRAIW